MKKKPQIKISIPFFILIASMYALDFGKVFFPTAIAVIIHEASHILAVRFVGGRIDRVEIKACGISVNVPELSYMSYTKEIIIAAAGPIAGVITAILATVAAETLGIYSMNYFAGINVVITAINLLPVFPLDGGRIVLSFGLKLFSLRAAYAISYILSLVSIGALVGICTYLAFCGELNPSLVVFSGYVAICGIKFRPTL